MNNYQDQIKRIKSKLVLAKQQDTNLSLFGAEEHEYVLDAPIASKVVEDFEEAHGILLPIEYTLFITQIGNGGAGPYYGVYSLGTHCSISYDAYSSLQLQGETKIAPDLSVDVWHKWVEEVYDSGDDDVLFETRLAALWGGILIIGTQGCTYHCGLVLNGPYRGRVVYVEDGSFQLPRFTYESHFLDWYERWLDDILEGNLTVENSGSFGYQMGGTVEHLLAVYLEADSSIKKAEALQGLLFKTLMDKETLDALSFDLDEQVAEVRYLIIALYLIHDYERAVGHLNKLFEEDLTAALLLLKDYAANHIVEWVELVKDAMIRISDEATFRAATSILLEDPEQDFECLRPFALHENNKIRIRTFGVLKTLKDKKAYEEVFLKGLDARERHEIIAVLRSLGDLKSKALLDKLKELVSVFPFMEIEPDEDGLKMITEHTHELVFISSNIAMALEAYGLDYDSVV